VPFRLEKGESLVHTYTVEVKRAMLDDDCFKVFQKYEKSVHGKDKEDPSGYERFLC